MEPLEVIEKANNPPLSCDFDLNLTPDDPIEGNHSAIDENTAQSSAKLGIVQGQVIGGRRRRRRREKEG
ncbi:hypothetical protein LINPERHAP1_LOCUS1426, partial [Linum perenne]